MTKPASTTVALAARVRQVRLLRGLTQSDVAARAGLSRATYQRFERAGVLGLDGFVRVLETLGLGHQVARLATDDAAAIAVAHAFRQRGRRQVQRPAAERTEQSESQPAQPAAPPPGAPAGGVPRASPGRGATRSTSADAAAVAKAAVEHRDIVTGLVRSIVFNRLTNHTAGGVVRTVMKAKSGLDAGTKAALVAAVEAELRQLNSENIAEHGIGAREFHAWQPTWNPDIGIARALE